MKSISELVSKRPWFGWALFLGTICVVFLLGLLAASIIERRTEAEFTFKPDINFGENEPRNEIWGQNFPREYNSWFQTSDTSFRSKHGGSATRDLLEENPRLVVLFAGYPFSKDFKQARGHFYAIDDIRATLRTGAPKDGVPSPMPNTCWTCKSPDVVRVMKEKGVKEFYSGTWESLGAEIVNPIGCLDCHDPKTMNLTITRPGLIEAMERQGIDVNSSTHQGMRSLVCAQCHVEYYFDKKNYEGAAYLTFPWDSGFSAESIEKYYDNIEFSDWTHALSRTPMIKAQHPDYELFMTGVHYKRGVACADCHMPYMNEGGQKFTNHQIQSPLNNISASCQVCHREETDSLIGDVYYRQDKIKEIRDQLEIQLVWVHVEAKAAWDNGASDAQMKPILNLIRQAQWRWDFIAASHGSSFHSPLEVSRIISHGLDKAREARMQLQRILLSLGVKEMIPYPEIETKIQAQEYIGLDMKALRAEKKVFIDLVIPKWQEIAKERESKYKVTYFIRE
jgi:nitrite reductase (cytochrome c-552)